MALDIEPGIVVHWSDLLAYFKELREEIIADMAAAKDDRALWRAQGALEQTQELLNLRDTFATLRAVESKEGIKRGRT